MCPRPIIATVSWHVRPTSFDGVVRVSLQFFMDHPYEVSPEPYATKIPSGFPSYCKNMP